MRVLGRIKNGCGRSGNDWTATIKVIGRLRGLDVLNGMKKADKEIV